MLTLSLAGALLGPAPSLAANKPTGAHTKRGRALVVSANLHEIDYPDASHSDDLRYFVKRLAQDLPHTPDVLALQEIGGYSTEEVASLLTKQFDDGFRVAVPAGNPPWRQLSATRVLGIDTAIVVNSRTMTTPRRGGYVRIGYPYRLSKPGQESRVKEHAFTLVRERRGGLAFPIVSVHFPKTDLFRSPKVSQRLKGLWMVRINRQLAQAYPQKSLRPMRVVAGDLNNKRCLSGQSRCRATPAFRVMTDRLNYTEAVITLQGWGNPIDFIFSRPNVVTSGWDLSARYRNHVYSDHGYRWALIERRDTTPPTSPGRIRKHNGSRKRVKLARWETARDGGSGLGHYVVRRSSKGRSRGFHTIGRTQDRRFSDPKVRAGRRYWYRVIAVDRAGNRSRSSRSAPVRAGTKPKPAHEHHHHHGSDRPEIQLTIPPK